MRYLLRGLHIAFNPAVELRSPAWLFNSGGGEAGLTREEKIISGCMIRQKLQRQLSDLNYRILKLSFTKPGNVEQALCDVIYIRPTVIENAKIYSMNDPRFVDLCCLNACWCVDLFQDRRYGPVQKYGRAELLSSRRRRISETIEMMKNLAVSTAAVILTQSYESERLVS
ncbi:hypothetical protein [Bacterioplanoides sp.]|uniref:hypothetical protein n=1 Tax=Bacterioplanoides sp. TaxID=2066072 RepID=UPI003B5C4C26